jgi:general stress protein YciG
MTDNPNPGNFANRPKEEVQEIASKGGQSSHSGGFASMDPDKQVSNTFPAIITQPYNIVS